jgi:hypothetical protein
MVFAAKLNPATEGREKIPPAAPKRAQRQRASDEREREAGLLRTCPGPGPRAPPATFHGSDSPACFRRRRSFIHSFILDALYACIDENGISSFFWFASTIIIQETQTQECM